MAKEEDLQLLKQGIYIWNEWRKYNPIENKLNNHPFEEFQFNLSGADLREIQLSGANLSVSNLASANLSGAVAIKANLNSAFLAMADLSGAVLCMADLSSSNLTNARLSRTDLRKANLQNVDLSGANLANEKKIGPILADVNLKDVNLLTTDWSNVKILGDEYFAKSGLDYNNAVRAYRQMGTLLREQGLTDEPNNFSFRAQVCNRKSLWHSRKYGKWAWSEFLNLLTGYGYKLGRAFLVYFLFIFSFAFIYWFSLNSVIREQRLWESIVEAIVGSINVFHGRSVTTELSTAIGQNWGYLLASGFEAIIGLIIEVALIATITKRLFSS